MEKIITKGTQKELVSYISEKYGIPKNTIVKKLASARKCSFLWDGFTLDNVKIIFTTEKGNMRVCEYMDC